MKIAIVANGISQASSQQNSNLKGRNEHGHHGLAEKITAADYIIAVDNGLFICALYKIVPDAVIGDFDSLSAEMLFWLESLSTTIIQYPVEKDQIDLELALDYAVNLGATHITLFNALGGRWDMSFANVLLLAQHKYGNISCQIVSEEVVLSVLSGPEKLLEILGSPKQIVSLLALTSVVDGVYTAGLKYPLKGESLKLGSTRGVSNCLLKKEAKVSLEQGTLLVVHHLSS